MDFAILNRGERIAGVAGVLLILIMFILDWFGPKGATDLGGTNAWQSYGITDIILFITALVAVALAVTAASSGELGLPVALSAIVTGLGIISVVLVAISIVSTPDYDVPGVLGGGEIDTSVKIGVFLGLIAAIGVTAGGWLAMQEEGTSFAGQADRFRGSGTGGPGASPPPPPSSTPPPPPPPSSTPPPSAGP